MPKKSDQDHNLSHIVFVVSTTVLAISAISLRVLALPYASHDWTIYLHEWYSHILVHGRFHALGDEFSNYSPPYLYLMAIVSTLDGLLSDLILIKLISIGFDIFCSIIVYKICMHVSGNKDYSLLFSLLFLNVPTVILNGSFWGQCDIIYTSLLLTTVYLLLTRRQGLAMVAFGSALAFKLQAIFIAPFLVYLVSIGAIRLRSALLAPLTYCLFLVPAALAGRPLLHLFSVYQGQATTNEPLVMSAPNLLLFITKLLSISFETGMVIGLGLAGLATCLLILSNLRREVTNRPEYLICAASLYLAIEPYFLPKMHDRYFFGADVFTFVFFAAKRKNLILPTLFQLASGLAYLAYFASNDPQLLAVAGPARYLGGLAMTAAVVSLTREYLRIPLKHPAWRLQLAV